MEHMSLPSRIPFFMSSVTQSLPPRVVLPNHPSSCVVFSTTPTVPPPPCINLNTLDLTNDGGSHAQMNV
ncbi:hypothetical protein LR48_Vigan205s007100 [Vigna angularis]|uniref:Uncharacterized protein n=1 Tax=Phaseolus angularis TaxID=3914 RepID=A0A0L9T752_PHAAN|nr:hypothetical protein LR48_Vigan205s007100 [Vigna angularis]